MKAYNACEMGPFAYTITLVLSSVGNWACLISLFIYHVEDASGEGEQECCFEEKGYHESSKMEGGVNLATPVYGDKPESKLDWLIDWYGRFLAATFNIQDHYLKVDLKDNACHCPLPNW